MTVAASKPRGSAPQSVEAAQIPDALLRIDVVKTITGFGETKIRELMAAGKFPSAIKLGPRCTRWHAAAVTAWCREQAGAE